MFVLYLKSDSSIHVKKKKDVNDITTTLKIYLLLFYRTFSLDYGNFSVQYVFIFLTALNIVNVYAFKFSFKK